MNYDYFIYRKTERNRLWFRSYFLFLLSNVHASCSCCYVLLFGMQCSIQDKLFKDESKAKKKKKQTNKYKTENDFHYSTVEYVVEFVAIKWIVRCTYTIWPCETICTYVFKFKWTNASNTSIYFSHECVLCAYTTQVSAARRFSLRMHT